jgi:hypothetical protein
VRDFRAKAGLGAGQSLDSATLHRLIETPAPDPVASRPYVTLALDLEWSDMTKVLLLTSQLEGMGLFGALNHNTDFAGLSFGIIQWAQKPGRLAEILQAFKDRDRDAYFRVFGGGNAAVANGLLNHVSLVKGGIVPATGETIDPAFDLIRPPWPERFLDAARIPAWQKVQIDAAMTAFAKSYGKIKTYAPAMNTERSAAFMLDLANQYGDGGARDIFAVTRQLGQSVEEHMEAMAVESVRRIKDHLKAGVRQRRRMFLDTAMLSDNAILS